MMIEEYRRRSFVSTGLITVCVLSAGCMGFDSPRNREVGFSRISFEQDVEGEFEITIRPLKSATGESREWNTFHDVVLLGYSRTGIQICRHRFGQMARNGTEVYDPATLNCDGFPVVFTFTARESPCDADTEVKIADYRGLHDGEHRWLAERRRTCGQGLPPEPPEDGWPDPPETLE